MAKDEFDRVLRDPGKSLKRCDETELVRLTVGQVRTIFYKLYQIKNTAEDTEAMAWPEPVNRNETLFLRA